MANGKKVGQGGGQGGGHTGGGQAAAAKNTTTLAGTLGVGVAFDGTQLAAILNVLAGGSAGGGVVDNAPILQAVDGLRTFVAAVLDSQGKKTDLVLAALARVEGKLDAVIQTMGVDAALLKAQLDDSTASLNLAMQEAGGAPAADKK